MRIASLLLCAAAALAQTPAPQNQPPQFDVVKSHNVLRVPGQEKAKLHRDVLYAAPHNEPQKMDIYLPAGTQASYRLPVVIALSGADKAKHWGFYKELGQLIAAHGMAGVIPDKRYQRGQRQEGTDDILALMKFVTENGAKYNLDGSKVCLWAFSGGGLLLNTAMRGETPTVKCIVNFYAVSDISRFPGATADMATSPLNPIHRLRSTDATKLPPMMIVRAGKDNADLNAGIEAFIAEAMRRNADITAINYPDGQHGFDLLDDNDKSRAIIRDAFAFLQRHLWTATPTAETTTTR
jgi:acetyl esterase/lipase